jgi:hypothetical protein
VGLSQVSNDWRITFFSKAERIWSQGLRTELGEVANDIVRILACVSAECLKKWLILRSYGNGSLTTENVLFHLAADDLMPVCRWSAREKLHSGRD